MVHVKLSVSPFHVLMHAPTLPATPHSKTELHSIYKFSYEYISRFRFPSAPVTTPSKSGGACERWCAGYREPWDVKCSWTSCGSCTECAGERLLRIDQLQSLSVSTTASASTTGRLLLISIVEP